MSDVTLYCDDCLRVMPELETGSVDAVITDPPYGTTNCKWDSVIPLEPMWECLKRVIKPNGAIVLFGSQPFTSVLIASNLGWFKYEWVWKKDNSSNFMLLKKQPGKIHENVLVFYDKQPVYNPQMRNGNKSHSTGNNIGKVQDKREYLGIDNFTIREATKTTLKYPVSVIGFNACGRGLAVHPTQKPVALLEYLIRTYTNPGDTVLDFTMGSGTTGVACVNTQRRFIGIENDEHYFTVAQQRIADARLQLPLL